MRIVTLSLQCGNNAGLEGSVVVGVMLSGVMAGVLAAFLALSAGHSPLSVALAYGIAGLLGSSLFMFLVLHRHVRGRTAR